MDERNWFEKKWGILSDVPTDSLIKRIEELEERMLKLEGENVETTNTLYEIMHDIDAVDARIDILHTHNDE